MSRTDVTYAQFGRGSAFVGLFMLALKKKPPSRVYEHESGALVTTPTYPMDDFVFDHHLLAARTTVDLFGIADSKVFDARLQKTWLSCPCLLLPLPQPLHHPHHIRPPLLKDRE